MPPLTSAWMRIGELSQRTGVTPELLRAWERRYGLLRPRRTDGRTRLYTAADETRVRLIQRYIQGGLAPSEAAEMVTATRLTIRPGETVAIPPAEVAGAHAAMHASLDSFDETTAQRALENLFSTYSPLTVVRDVMVPYLREVGERWAEGHVTVAQEHFATNFLHARLLAFARGWDRGLGPRAILACARGERHTFGLISFGVALHQLGWRITYLGADTTASMIQEAAEHVAPDPIVVYAAAPARMTAIADGLQALRSRNRLGGAAPEGRRALLRLPQTSRRLRALGRRGMVRATQSKGRVLMPKYLIEASYTVEGVEGVRTKGGSSRRDAVAHTAESLGGQLDAFYFAFGDHDAVVIADLPDNEAAAAIALSVDAAAGATTKTTVLLTPEQVDDAAQRSVKAVDYRPPGT